MNKKHFAVLTLALLFALPLLARPVAAYSLSVTPGSTTTVFGIPVTYTVTGCEPSTGWDVIETEAGVNTTIHDSLQSDSSGVLRFTLTPDDYGANVYYVNGEAAGQGAEVSFTVDNMDIMPYIIILITISILFGVLKTFTGKGSGLF